MMFFRSAGWSEEIAMCTGYSGGVLVNNLFICWQSQWLVKTGRFFEKNRGGPLNNHSAMARK